MSDLQAVLLFEFGVIVVVVAAEVVLKMIGKERDRE